MIGTVYLLLSISPDNIESHKIGITTKIVERRVKALQTGNPNIITVLKQYKTSNYRKVESTLHRVFNCRTEARNEWRTLTDEQVDSFLDECKRIDNIIEFLYVHNHFYK
jgi:hypothetical protein